MGKSNYGAFMEFMKGKVTEPTLNTYTEIALVTPASKTEQMAMLIHQILLRVDGPDPVDADLSYVYAQLTKRTMSGFTEVDDPACLYSRIWSQKLGIAEGTLSEYACFSQGHWPIIYFDPPILYTRDYMYLAVLGDANTVVKSAYLSLGYTIEKVTTEQFIAALVE